MQACSILNIGIVCIWTGEDTSLGCWVCIQVRKLRTTFYATIGRVICEEARVESAVRHADPLDEVSPRTRRTLLDTGCTIIIGIAIFRAG